MTTRPHDQANPVVTKREHGDFGHILYETKNGLSKREYFASAALESIIRHAESNPEDAAAEAVRHADALIEALNQ